MYRGRLHLHAIFVLVEITFLVAFLLFATNLTPVLAFDLRFVLGFVDFGQLKMDG